jgi:hypothetical protein
MSLSAVEVFKAILPVVVKIIQALIGVELVSALINRIARGCRQALMFVIDAANLHGLITSSLYADLSRGLKA